MKDRLASEKDTTEKREDDPTPVIIAVGSCCFWTRATLNDLIRTEESHVKGVAIKLTWRCGKPGIGLSSMRRRLRERPD